MLAWMIQNREKMIAFATASSLAMPFITLADVRPAQVTKVSSGFKNIGSTIETVFSIIITVAGVAFVVLFLLGGIQYLGAAGNDEGTKKARQLMLDAVIGLAIVVVAWAVGTYVLTLLGLSDNGGIILDPTRVGTP